MKTDGVNHLALVCRDDVRHAPANAKAPAHA
jgi:hypothetical protein